MQTIFVFVIVLVLPNGEVAVQSKKTNICPDTNVFAEYMAENMEKGLIYDWSAKCIKSQNYYPGRDA